MELPPHNREWMYPGRMMPQDHLPMMERPDFMFHESYSRYNVPERVHFKEDECKEESNSRTESPKILESSEAEVPVKNESDGEEIAEEDDDLFINVDGDD